MTEDGGGRKGGGGGPRYRGFGAAGAGLGSVPGAQADAGAVVRCADEFDAGGFVECFEGRKMPFASCWNTFGRLVPFQSSGTDGCLFCHISNSYSQSRSRRFYLDGS